MMRMSTLRHCSAPTGAEFGFLDQAQQLHLHFERQVADFIEKGRTAIGQLHQTLFVLGGSAERSPDMAEEVALHQSAHQRPAVDGNELAHGIALVDRPGDHLLAGAAFA